jgi:hypothetical protein
MVKRYLSRLLSLRKPAAWLCGQIGSRELVRREIWRSVFAGVERGRTAELGLPSWVASGCAAAPKVRRFEKGAGIGVWFGPAQFFLPAQFFAPAWFRLATQFWIVLLRLGPWWC